MNSPRSARLPPNAEPLGGINSQLRGGLPYSAQKRAGRRPAPLRPRTFRKCSAQAGKPVPRRRLKATGDVETRGRAGGPRLLLTLPADGVVLVLLIEPLLQGREVVADGRGVHLAGAGDLF